MPFLPYECEQDFDTVGHHVAGPTRRREVFARAWETAPQGALTAFLRIGRTGPINC